MVIALSIATREAIPLTSCGPVHGGANGAEATVRLKPAIAHQPLEIAVHLLPDPWRDRLRGEILQPPANRIEANGERSVGARQRVQARPHSEHARLLDRALHDERQRAADQKVALLRQIPSARRDRRADHAHPRTNFAAVQQHHLTRASVTGRFFRPAKPPRQRGIFWCAPPFSRCAFHHSARSRAPCLYPRDKDRSRGMGWNPCASAPHAVSEYRSTVRGPVKRPELTAGGFFEGRGEGAQEEEARQRASLEATQPLPRRA